MIAVYAKSKVNENNVEKFMSLAEQLINETRKEKGNISYELIREIEDRTILAFMEKWESQEILDIHMKTPHFTSIVPQLGELIEGEMQITIHEVVI